MRAMPKKPNTEAQVPTLITSSRYFIELAASEAGDRNRRVPTLIMMIDIDSS